MIKYNYSLLLFTLSSTKATNYATHTTLADYIDLNLLYNDIHDGIAYIIINSYKHTHPKKFSKKSHHYIIFSKTMIIILFFNYVL